MKYDGYIKYDEKIANNYDVDRQEEEHWKLENTYIEKFYKNRQLSTLLDLPVGTGRFLKYYENVNTLIGIDISDDMLNIAKEKTKSLQSNISLLKGDAFNLNYPDNYFMHTVCFRLLHLIPPEERQKLFNELTRVTSEKIILQVYMNTTVPLYKKIYHKLSTLFTSSQQNIKPWNHIQSYGLHQKDFDHFIHLTNLRIDNKTFLCNYEGGKVYVFELSKI
jgi:ubiquinone/menaquinone biosynthesis C-methylase UbiE